ncbi:Phage transcriptional regulator, AlpA [Mycoavidus cysteinexigens]|uniref:Phage transcriptional regulator, AlpA n=1 Tax=Mycoavidus cysteinexigens TaxID=1553431 RepID=A0A2Z6ESB5_9BURK|nr:AlpA family transcriptional regulator [Mycoavidus cysteinexigens]BBE08295.1 Phage transcriptional regulator, AlpA [Mycoavidus cysteinexigens]GLR00801.1 hypothetical protein GCM10007934_06130 [Mycoavidus cysteinexigens]
MADQAVPILIPRWRVCQITGMKRSALYDRIKRGEFPKPVKIGRVAVRWIESEIITWVQQRIDVSRSVEVSHEK